MRVLICGGGVIGTSIAYFLSRRDIEPVVIERTGIANAASGKSGGFLALDWCDGSPMEPLARRSFGLHAEARRADRRRLGLPPGRHARRRRQRAPRRGLLPTARGARLAGRRHGGSRQARHRRDHGPGRPGGLHQGHDAGGDRRRRAPADRHRRRPRLHRERRRAGRRGGWAGNRGRRGRHRHGALVRSRQPVAAAPCGLRSEGAQSALPLCAAVDTSRALRGA